MRTASTSRWSGSAGTINIESMCRGESYVVSQSSNAARAINGPWRSVTPGVSVLAVSCSRRRAFATQSSRHLALADKAAALLLHCTSPEPAQSGHGNICPLMSVFGGEPDVVQ